MSTKKTTTRPFLGSDRVPPTSGGQSSVFLLFDSEQKTNTKETTPWPFLGSDRVPPTSGGQTDECCTFVNHMEMHACAMHMHMRMCMHTYLHPHRHMRCAHGRTCTNTACAHTQTQLLFDANLDKMPGRTRKRPQRPKSSFEQLQASAIEARKWCQSDNRSAFLKHRSFFRE